MGHPYHTFEQITPAAVTELDMIQLTNDIGGEEVVSAVWEEAREEADSQIDTYLGERYVVPLAEVPPAIRRLSIILTRYNLYGRRYPGDVPKAVEKTYDNAVKVLEGMARGKPSLGLQPAPTPNVERSARLVSTDRVFTVDSLKDF